MENSAIIQELSDLGSSLSGISASRPYAVPPGYFENFPSSVVGIIKDDLSWATITSVSNEHPFMIPEGYFDGLEQKIMSFVRSHPDYQSSREELESISPLLNRLDKRPVYTVPEGYFENLKVAETGSNNTSTAGKVVSMKARNLFRYAAAAAAAVIILVAGWFAYNSGHKDPAGGTLAKFEKEVKSINDVNKTDSLIELMDADLNQKELASNQPVVKTDDVQKLLQDVSSDELKDFNDQSKDIEDVMMTN